MEKQKIEFSWEDTGKLDIEVVGNLSATLRYRPSDKFVAETLAKFRKNTEKPSKTPRPPNTKVETKGPQKA